MTSRELSKYEEKINIYRILAITLIVAATLGITVALCAKSHFYIDEWLCMGFLDLIFIFIFIFELEYHRCHNHLFQNMQTSFIRLAIIYTVNCVLIFLMTFLPEFFRPVLLIPILMSAVSNTTIAWTTGVFLNILLAMAAGGNFYTLGCYVILTVFGSVLSEALIEKKYRTWLAAVFCFLNLLIPELFYYMSCKEFHAGHLLYGLFNGLLCVLMVTYGFEKLLYHAKKESDNLLVDIVEEEYSEVCALKYFSKKEYVHAKKVSEIVYRCAGFIGYNANLCRAAGFYYRLGLWLGEPYIKNAVDKAYSLCFPDKLVDILSEYYGLEHAPSTPESALVHMVDALVIKLEALEQNVEKSQWNHEMLIYQALNEYSASGLYDKSGMSMNHFLKIREFLVKEELLQ